MKCFLDTNHFVGTPTFFRIMLLIFTLLGGGGGGYIVLGKTPWANFSLLCSDHFVSHVTDNLN